MWKDLKETFAHHKGFKGKTPFLLNDHLCNWTKLTTLSGLQLQAYVLDEVEKFLTFKLLLIKQHFKIPVFKTRNFC